MLDLPQQELPAHEIINNLVSLLDYLNDNNITDFKESQLPLSISCPLHTDRKPSFRLYRPKDKGGYCFSCGKAFTAFSIHRALNNISYRETVQYFVDTYPELEIESLLKQASNSGEDITRKSKSNSAIAYKLSEVSHKMIEYVRNSEDRKSDFREMERRIFLAYNRK